MRWFRRHPGVIGWLALLAMAGYLVAALGVLPSPRMMAGWLGLGEAERYPCENCPCGCASAGECWRRCCCHTPEERLAWAIENGVRPPSGVGFTDAQWMAAANLVTPGRAHCLLCVSGIKADLQRGMAMRRTAVCVETCDGSCGPEKSLGGARKSHRAGPMMSALSCKGLQELSTISLPPALPVVIELYVLPEAGCFASRALRDMVPASRSLDVPAPPPRLALALS